MKLLSIRYCGIGALLLFVAVPASGWTGTDTAIATGTAAGLMVLVPTVAEVLTYSEIEVKVETYSETVPLPEDKLSNLSPDKKRSDPFRLGGPTAVLRAEQKAQSTSQLSKSDILIIAENLSNQTDKLSRLIQQYNYSIKTMKTLIESSNSSYLSKVLQDMESRSLAAQKLSQAINDFMQQVLNTVGPNIMNEAEVSKARDSIAKIQILAKLNQSSYQKDAVLLLNNQIDGIFNQTGIQLTTVAEIINMLMPTDGLTEDEKIAAKVFNVLQFLAKAEKGGGKVVNGDKFLEFDPEKQKIAKNSLVNVLNAFGFPVVIASAAEVKPGELSLETLAAAKNSNAVRDLLFNYSLTFQTNKVASSTRTATYMGVAIGANIGPIINEATQSIFSKSQIIDAMLSKDNWKMVNYAYSKSHAGDHNAVIYFDNNLTPILKTGSFDPSDFITANAQLYKRVAGSLADVFGVPINVSNNTSNSLPELNLFSQQARKQNAQQAAAKGRKALLDALDKLVTTANVLQGQTSATGSFTETQLGDLKNSLDQLLKNLQAQEASLKL